MEADRVGGDAEPRGLEQREAMQRPAASVSEQREGVDDGGVL